MVAAEHHKSRLPLLLTSLGLLLLLGTAIGISLWNLRRAPWRNIEAIETLVGRENLNCGTHSNGLSVWIMQAAGLFCYQTNLPNSRLWIEPDYASPLDLIITSKLSPAQFPELSARLAQVPAVISIKFLDANASDAEIAKFITPLAGKINYFINHGPSQIGDQTLRVLLPAAKDGLLDLRLRNTAVTDAGLAEIGKCTQLRALILGKTKITDACLVGLAKCPTLWILDLSETLVTDAGLENVARCADLHMLALQGTAVTDAGIMQLARCKGLMMLYAAKTKITAAAIAKLKAESAGREPALEVSQEPIFRMPR